MRSVKTLSAAATSYSFHSLLKTFKALFSKVFGKYPNEILMCSNFLIQKLNGKNILSSLSFFKFIYNPNIHFTQHNHLNDA